MLGHASATLDHEQQLAGLRQSMVALCLVGLCEDLPMGTHNNITSSSSTTHLRNPPLYVALSKSKRGLLVGILGAYFFHRSDAECLEKLPACNLTSETALTIFCSCLTSFLMLGWKLGQAFKTHTKINELAKYRALYQQVAGSYGEDEAERLKRLADGEAAAAAPVPGGSHISPSSCNRPLGHWRSGCAAAPCSSRASAAPWRWCRAASTPFRGSPSHAGFRCAEPR
jgi:hypothetical protein